MDDKLKEKLLELPKENLVEYIDNLFEIEQYEYEKLIKIKEYINRTEINSVGKPLAYTEIGKELLEILEEIE